MGSEKLERTRNRFFGPCSKRVNLGTTALAPLSVKVRPGLGAGYAAVDSPVEGEAEDIRGHLMSLDDLMALVASGEVENAPLILTALWMQRERGRLRADLPERPEDP